jgi:GTPase
MYTDELKEIWELAAENSEGAENYFYDREVVVNGVHLEFNVDLNTAIYYTISGGLGDDLVDAKEPAGKNSTSKVIESPDEFVSHVEEVVESWDEQY